MEKFTRLTGIAAPLDMINVDTDKIIPKQFLTTIERKGLGRGLFYELRFDENGAERPDFVLNRAPWRDARILIAGENFGCGSSREHAPWALLDWGIRCIVAPSFADIFYNNCFKNGILPVVLDAAEVEALMADARDAENPVLTVDLEARRIVRPNGAEIAFEIDPFRRRCLLEGLDDIGLTLARADRIDAFEARQRTEQPWLWAAGPAASPS